MPKQKPVENAVTEASSSDVKKRASKGSKPKTPAATHKRSSKKTVPESVVEVRPAAPVLPAVLSPSAIAEVPAPPRRPSREEIAALAYALWERRGYQHGSPEDDWFRAERELTELAQNR